MANTKSKVKGQKSKVNKTTAKTTSATVSKPKTKNSKPKTESAKLNIVAPNSENLLIKISEKATNFKPNKNFYIILIIIGVLVLGYYKKSWFVAASVDGQPISNLELQMQLNQQFRNQVLTELVNEKIVIDEAAKNNAIPTEAEIDAKIAQIETQLGGAQAFDSMLSQQGQDRKSIRPQIKIQLAIEKLYSNEATVSAQEVDQYITQNKDSMQATDSAGQMKEANDALKQQKLSQIFQQKFQELKQKAKVQTY